ncbi:HAD family hydrolase [Candidatus Woesearchaeota archaeon]|nr:HAD family hydrolase [Candidatus Woesearchaeota archaeon]
MAELIIFDCYGTIVPAGDDPNFRYAVRQGFHRLLYHYEDDRKMAVFSDADKRTLDFCLLKVGLGRLDAYNEDHLTLERLKNLAVVCSDFEVEPSNSVFIGDNYADRDRLSAEQYGVNFIQIPQYRLTPISENDRKHYEKWLIHDDPRKPWSFEELIGSL